MVSTQIFRKRGAEVTVVIKIVHQMGTKRTSKTSSAVAIPDDGFEFMEGAPVIGALHGYEGGAFFRH